MSTSTEEDATTSELIVPSYRVIDLPPDQRVQSHRRVKPDQPDIGLTCQTFKQQFQDERGIPTWTENYFLSFYHLIKKKTVLKKPVLNLFFPDFADHKEGIYCKSVMEDFSCSNCGDEFKHKYELMQHVELCEDGPGKSQSQLVLPKEELFLQFN